MQLVARWAWGLSARVWIVWAIVACALTLDPFRWHVEYFRSPGPAFYRAIFVFIPALAIACYAFCRFRTPAVRSVELPALALIVLVPSFFYEPRGALTAVFLAAGAAAWGSAVLAGLGLEEDPPLERALYAIGAGFGLLILLLLALGLTGLYRWEVFAALLGAPLVFRARSLLGLCGELRSAAGRWSDDPGTANALVGASVFFAAVFLPIAAMLILAPTVAHDALLMHLPAARNFAATGALTPLPFQPYSIYPQGFETLMTVAYALGGLPAAQFVNPMFFALSLGAVFLIGRQLGCSRGACFFAASALLAVPFLLWDGSAVKNDLAVAAFQLLAISCALGARDAGATSRLRAGVFLLASSLTIKYTSFFGLPWVGLLLLYQLRGRTDKVREIALWALIFGAVALPWQARAYALTGNPIFPEDLGRIVGRVVPAVDTGKVWRSIPYVKIPWYVHFTGLRAFESPSPNPLGFFLLTSLPVWLMVKRRELNRKAIALGVLSASYFLLWGLVFPFLRYAIVLAALVFLLASERFEALYRQGGGKLRGALWALAVYNFLFCLLPALILSVNGPQLLLFTGRIDKTEYLRRALAPYGAIEFLQQAAGPNDLILGAQLTTAGYAPNPAAFHPMHVQNERETAAAKAALAERNYRFLVASDTAHGRRLGTTLAEGYRSTLEYEDGRFVVFRLERVE